MNIPLNVLIEAVATMQMLRDVADPLLNTSQFMQAMRSHSELGAYVKQITEKINVEIA